MQTYFRIQTHVLDKQQQVLKNLRVEVWGKQDNVDDLIDITTSDENGSFVTEFSAEYDAERVYGRYDQLFFNVYSGNRQFKSIQVIDTSQSLTSVTSFSIKLVVDLAGGHIVEARSIGLPSQTFGDGTSQLQRKLLALDPQYAAVEERSIEDFIDITRGYAQQLPYHDANDASNNVRWTEFLPNSNNLSTHEIAEFLEDPQSFRIKYPEYALLLSQPHRTLFFSFLQLLQYAKKEINKITKRHLDFFYQEALRIAKKSAAPDEVHVLFELKRDIEQHSIPAGILLKAGEDSQGKERFYKSNTALVVNKAQITQLKTVFNKRDRLYAAPDATQVTAEAFTNQDILPWKTFGGPVKQPTCLGFAFASPQLHLSEGKRTITLTLDLQSSESSTSELTTAQKKLLLSPEGPFQFLLSSAQGWISPDVVTARLQDKAIQYILTLFPESTAIEPLQEQENATDPVSPHPVLKMEVKQDPLDKAPRDYGLLRQLQLQKIHLQVQVEGIQNFHLSNDRSTLDPQKPFEPFGTAPKAGNSFQVSHPEIAAKKLDTLALDIQWTEMPNSDLGAYYEHYFEILNADQQSTEGDQQSLNNSTTLNNASFRWHSQFFDRGRMIDTDQALDSSFFDNADATQPKTVSLTAVLATLSHSREDGYQYERLPELAQQVNTERYFDFSLVLPDFQHSVYPTLFVKQANSTQEDIKQLTIEQPYTPTIKRLSINYSSTIEVDLANYGSEQRKLDQLFYLHPFGYAQWSTSNTQPLQKAHTWLPEYINEGELYIGLQDLQPTQNVSILFQMADGSANPAIQSTPQIQWSYLSNNQWIPFSENDIISDTTANPAEATPTSLARTGIIVFYLPPDASTKHTILPKGLHWIKATVKENSDGLSQAIALHTQAIQATFQDNQNAPDHYSRALPPNSITGLEVPIPAVASVSQPYAAFSGRPPEQEDAFYTRTSERLRHKNRAIGLWDYERMVLEQFPEVYKVKCLTANDQLPPGIGELPQSLAPGEVLVVVIPDVKNRWSFKPLEPKISQATLQKIRAYLQKYISPFVSIQVRNPVYEQVKTRCTVQFTKGYDVDYYKKVLQQDLKKYLAPWAYEQGADIALGSKLYANALIYFLEKRPYIDFVANLKLSHSVDGQNFVYTATDEGQENAVYASRPDAILVTSADHQVEELAALFPNADYEEQKLRGIGYMTVGTDAQVKAVPI